MKQMWANCLRGRCPAYNGWGCFLTTVVLGLIFILLAVGLGGPIYNDCENVDSDCSMQRSYGLYCEDYCWFGNSGPGSSLVILLFFALITALLVPYCMHGDGRTTRIFDKPYYYSEPYQIINVN